MNNQPVFTVTNPLQRTIEESEEIIGRIEDCSELLEAHLADERLWFGHYRDALDNYEVAETDVLSEVIIAAQNKEGPLAGLATSSEAYKVTLTKLKNGLRRGSLAQLWQKAEDLRRKHEMAQIELEQVQTRFGALRKIVDLKTQVLRASTI